MKTCDKCQGSGYMSFADSQLTRRREVCPECGGGGTVVTQVEVVAWLRLKGWSDCADAIEASPDGNKPG